MTFLHASLAIAGVACVAIPIIIHLLMHRRRKPVMWGAMRFLLEAYRRQRRRLILEKWLLLAVRCLVLALLGLAIGRPLLGAFAGGRGGKTVYIVIDNSLAASLVDESDGRGRWSGETALDRHKASAKEVLAAMRSARGAEGEAGADRVGLIALAAPAEGIVIPASSDIDAVSKLIDSLESADSRADFAGAWAILASVSGAKSDGAEFPSGAADAGPNEDRYVAVLSDFLEGSADLSAASGGPGVRLPAGFKMLATEPIEAAPGNVSIVAVEPLRSVVVTGEDAIGVASGGGASGNGASGQGTGTDQVRVVLRRSGAASGESRVRAGSPGTSGSQSTTVRARMVSVNPSGVVDAASDDRSAPEARAVVRWNAGDEFSAVSMVLPPRRPSAGDRSGGHALIIASIDNDALTGDNTWRRPIEVREALRVGVVAPTQFGKAERADRLDPGAWSRLALVPGGPSGGASSGGASSGIEVVDIEPASMDGARLATLDALILPRPDLVPEASWARVKLFMASGGLVMVMPPPNVSVHLWGDAMSSMLGAPFTVARESRSAGVRTDGASSDVDETAAWRMVLSEAAASNATGAASTGASAGLLTLLRGEMDELLKPVAVRRVLPIEPRESGAGSGVRAESDGGEVLLKLEEGTPVLWAGKLVEPVASESAGSEASGSGLLIYLGVALDLEWSDLPARPLMVPLMQELVRQGVGRARGTWWSVAGGGLSLPRQSAELIPIPMAGQGDELASVPVNASGLPAAPMRRAGLWRAVDERGGVRAVVALNADARGGKTETQARDSVGAWLSGAITPVSGSSSAGAEAITWLPSGGESARPALGGTSTASSGASVQSVLAKLFGDAERGSPISLPLLIAVLALAVLEVFLARRASHADLAAAGARGGWRAIFGSIMPTRIDAAAQGSGQTGGGGS